MSCNCVKCFSFPHFRPRLTLVGSFFVAKIQVIKLGRIVQELCRCARGGIVSGLRTRDVPRVGGIAIPHGDLAKEGSSSCYIGQTD